MTKRDTIEPINNYGRYALEKGSDRRAHGAAPVGRYDGRSHNTRMPPGGLARTPVKGATIVGAVPDPWGQGDQRLFATIDRRVDILEMERSHKRISEAAYQTGRQVQAVLERQGKVRTADWAGASRGDPGLANELRIILGVLHAREIIALQERIRGRIGVCDMRLLRRVIGDRISFGDCAALEGKGGARGTWYVANRFRDALEELADVFAGKGAARSAPDDAYRAAANDLAPRQTAAVLAGVTRQRLQDDLEETRVAAAEAKTPALRARLSAEADAIAERLARMTQADLAGPGTDAAMKASHLT